MSDIIAEMKRSRPVNGPQHVSDTGLSYWRYESGTIAPAARYHWYHWFKWLYIIPRGHRHRYLTGTTMVPGVTTPLWASRVAHFKVWFGPLTHGLRTLVGSHVMVGSWNLPGLLRSREVWYHPVPSWYRSIIGAYGLGGWYKVI